MIVQVQKMLGLYGSELLTVGKYNKVSMWNAIASSKLIQWKIDLQNYQTHRKNLSKIKTIMKISSPIKPVFMQKKPTLKLILKQQKQKRQKQDKAMQNKIDALKPDSILSHVVKTYKRPRSSSRQVQVEEIQKDTLRLAYRLSNIGTCYPSSQFKKQWKKMVQISKNISQSTKKSRSKKKLKHNKSLKQNEHQKQGGNSPKKSRRIRSAFTRSTPIHQAQQLRQQHPLLPQPQIENIR